MSLHISDKSEEEHVKSLPGNQGMIFTLLLFILVLLVTIGFVITKRSLISNGFSTQWFSDFSNMQVSDGFHQVTIPGGNHWTIAYEADHEVIFQGTVLHNSPIREKGFEIMTQDILVTTGDFSDPELVSTKVYDHKFIYHSLNANQPSGTINLLHTLPMNEEIDQQLQQIQPGDEVIIKGWEILNLKGWNEQELFIGTWQDAGCNSTLVTQVIINPVK